MRLHPIVTAVAPVIASMGGGLLLFALGITVAQNNISGNSVAASVQQAEENNEMGAVGGPDAATGAVAEPRELETETAADTSEERIRRLRHKQAVLSRREEMLRYQLAQIERQDSEEHRRSRNTLVMLLKDQEDTDERLVEFLRQVWEADGKAHVSTIGMESTDRIVISWPVPPTRGISADFEDPYYLKRFGMAHEAIDIPALQGTEIKAAADGVVSNVANNGMGYSYLIIRHNGFATLYGHVTKFKVSPGQQVSEGDVVALSGGQPGTPGAGALTTGAHLHFELISEGRKIDPMPYLPYSSTVEVVREWKNE